MKAHLFQFMLLSLFALTFWSCQGQKKDFDKVVYAYQDSSVPPEFHRSYTIVWQSNGKGSVSVDVYNDTIASQDFDLKAEDFKTLQDLVKNIQSGGKKTSNASGTSHQLIQLFAQEKKIYERYWDNLNGEKEATQSFVKFIKENTPNLKKLLDTPYDVSTTSRKELFAKVEYDELMSYKKTLAELKDSEQEKEILDKIWQVTRKNIEIIDGKKPDYKFGLRVSKRGAEDTPINFKVYAEYYNTSQDLPWDERVIWEIDFSHKLLDTENYYLLLRE